MRQRAVAATRRPFHLAREARLHFRRIAPISLVDLRKQSVAGISYDKELGKREIETDILEQILDTFSSVIQ